VVRALQNVCLVSVLELNQCLLYLHRPTGTSVRPMPSIRGSLTQENSVRARQETENEEIEDEIPGHMRNGSLR
jgi:hypothetical protein